MSSIGPFAAPGRWFKGNLHTHSTASDGALAPAEVCRRYREAGYDFLALTDHFLARFGWPIVETSGWRTDAFTTLLGAEVHAPATRHGDLWHLLAVGLPLDFAPPARGEDGAALARRAAKAGAFVALAHPEWSGLEPEDGLSVEAVHAVEIYNHTSQVRCDRGGGAALLDALLVRGRRPTAIAVDDAHFKDADAFGGWVMVRAAALEPGALLEALKAGAFYASQGPELRDLSIEDGGLVVETSPCKRIAVLGAGALNAGASGADITRARIELAPFRRSGFCRVVALDAAGRRAWSNAIDLLAPSPG